MYCPSPLFAFELVSPAMLGWLAAAAAPLLIHLWSRRRYREMTWAAMEYLLAALRRSQRRIRIEQWLLLLVRTLLIVLIVLSVAEPFWERARLTLASGEPTHRVIVIDGSYSMGYRPTDKSRFERAKELAVRIVEESRPGDGFTLLLMSSPARVVVGTPVFEPRDFLQEIEGLKLPHTTADLPTTVARVEQVLVAARREFPRLTREEVYFLTDLGRVGWVPAAADLTSESEFRRCSQRLAQDATLVVIDLGQPAAENVAVTGLRAAEPLARVGHDVGIDAELKNFGRQARGRQEVELLADGRRVKQERVDVAPGGEAVVRFNYRFDAPGDHVLEVRSEGDLLDIDNHRWISVPVRQSIQVLCVDGRPSGDRFGGATGYLRLALSPAKDDSSTALVRSQVVSESGLVELDLSRYDCVFLANVPQFTANEARLLDAYLANGGSLVFFLGDRVLADRYNRELGGQRPGGVRLLPAQLGGVIDRPQQRLDPLEYAHPIVRAFRGRERALLLPTPIEKYFKLTVPGKSAARVVLRLANGDPLIVEEPIRRGRVILVATSPDTTWTAMPLLPSYPALVQEMLAFAVAGQRDPRNVLVGQALTGTIPTSAGSVPLSIRCPDGHSETVRLESEGDYSTWSYGDTGTSGVYAARIGPPVARTDLFAVNVDPVESDLICLSEDQLREEVWPDVPFLLRTSLEDLDQQPVTQSGRRGGLAKEFLYAVLLLLFVETLLAWRFGHHAS